ncbi:hypothetical protein ACQ5SP_04435 [Rhodovulum sp. YNF3179]|uniref:hypothetical protein n=1 Tax=Rhodovulum sp. YNF3179 TaxID=3425127 RepID=UPI003D3264F4
MRIAGLLLLMALAAGCSRGRDVVTFDGYRLDARVTKLGEDRRNMAIRVRPAAVPGQSAQKAARYAATKHCIEYTGVSDAVFDADPETGLWLYELDGDARIYSGRCTG